MGQIKESFTRVKEDFTLLTNELFMINKNIECLRAELLSLCKVVDVINNNQNSLEIRNQNMFAQSNLLEKKASELSSTIDLVKNKSEEKGIFLDSSLQQINTAIQQINTAIQQIMPTLQQLDPAHNLLNNLQKDENKTFSTGNGGVPTDRQTDQQTDKLPLANPSSSIPITNSSLRLEDASEILSNLDSIKKEVRIKFKRLTEQEMAVFSTIYILEEEQGFADYRSLSQRLNLTESSIRDYLGRIVSKGIPVDKKKVNNKTIQLFISPTLKRIASLSTILQLREL